MRFGVVVFPGSNCDADCYYVIDQVLKAPVEFIWHKETEIKGFDGLILPGGFSYGDYLRTGAIARFSPIMQSVSDFADRGGLVIGICNGFQILLEAGLLPGAMLRNNSLRFSCLPVNLKVKTDQSAFTGGFEADEVIALPIAHGEGNYYCDDVTYQELLDFDQIAFTYCNKDGLETPGANPNGSRGNVAGILNRERNVLGMMPHPERFSEGILGGEDGARIFASMLKSFKEGLG
ncbi:MAG: phosphoribosylformylglycinamidine synthase subunit PurQ [Syntrophomonadaceae bacterium]|nr:phosphoribosylformylglycinamidine synthase subunit PurQ [Syntrophomonadaceae bacterium]